MTTAGNSKTVRVSTDNFVSENEKLPADSPSLNRNGVLADNTDLSNNAGFKSRFPGLKDFNFAADGNFKPDTTYQFDIKRGGTPTVFTTEAFSVVSGLTFKIDTEAFEIFDREATNFEFFDDGNPVSFDSIDFLNGTVTLSGTPSGVVTGTGTYIPITTSDCISTATIDLSVEVEEDTSIKINNGANTNGFKTRVQKLRDVSATLTLFDDLSKAYFNDLNTDENVLLEVKIGTGSAIQTIRGWFLVESDNTSGAVADLETEEVTLQLDGDLLSSFTWIYPTDTSLFSAALKILTDNFFNGGALAMQYIPADILANGFQGPVVLESFSLNLDINGKVTFSSTLQGNGELVSLV